jgi:uncharacterized phage protein gp47/JayE
MPYARPTLNALITQAIQDVVNSEITDPNTQTVLNGLLTNAVLRILPTVLAGLVWQEYGYIDWVSKQAVPWSATDEFLEGWAALKGVNREDATAASGVFVIASGCTNGSDLPAGATISCQANGLSYTTQADAVATSGAISVAVLCTAAASAGNIPAGTALTISGTYAGIPSAGVAQAAFTGGSDQETDDDLRTRMLLAYSAPPQGGDAADYVEWAEATPGVTRAWVLPNSAGAGTVTVFTMFDEAEAAYSGFPQGSNGAASSETRATPATGDQLSVANSIYPKQPVTALVYSYAPVPQAVNFAVGNLGSNNTTAMQEAITAALTDMFLRLGYVGGTLNPVTGEAWSTIDPSDWYAALSSVSGIGRFSVSSPTAPIAVTTGSLPVLGTVTFSS